ncbi:MAG: tetratricopeptide repeat protein [Planctomycetota bacterium]
MLKSLSGRQEELHKDEPSAGLVSARQGQYTEQDLEQETIAVLSRLAKDFPNSSDPLGLMGDNYLELGKTAEAMKCWQKCIELEPRRPDSYVRMAETAVDTGQFDRAVAIAQKALKINPAMAGIHSQLGRALRGLAKPAESLAALEKAVRISPESAANHHLLGQAYQQLQQHEKAKQSYMKALKINPNYTEACYGIISAFARLEQKDEAARYREKFKEMKARDWQTLPDERDYVLQQRFAVKSRRRASKAHTNAGILYYEDGRRQTAEKHWLRGAELDPVNTGCREELMTLYQQGGRNKEALGMCEQLLQLAPDNPQYHMCAGTLLTRLNRIDEALQAVKRAIEIEPNNAAFRQIYDQIQKRKHGAPD